MLEKQHFDLWCRLRRFASVSSWCLEKANRRGNPSDSLLGETCAAGHTDSKFSEGVFSLCGPFGKLGQEEGSQQVT